MLSGKHQGPMYILYSCVIYLIDSWMIRTQFREFPSYQIIWIPRHISLPHVSTYRLSERKVNIPFFSSCTGVISTITVKILWRTADKARTFFNFGDYLLRNQFERRVEACWTCKYSVSNSGSPKVGLSYICSEEQSHRDRKTTRLHSN